ncbi:MAG: cation diffusion facilitator family transporter [Deltaproteobacteria bacterium]|jgi:ferrous-iron efflux pump FieF|nr:cation diffusion facilitator family transporter [Deltaproteobacteria bacterium]MBT6433572.1 cation diffusion facilitator family transporter [Deltaproteobacteria bacterium]MBT6491273.1 cation diffusion facilitator family transporter [Deltaproteobacteria bacterium]
MSNESETRQWTRKLPTAVVAIVIVATLVVIKTIAYFQSGSMSILASLTDSLLDSVVSVMALVTILYAQQPADEDHRWGHGKMEAVSALVQASIIFGGAAFLVFTSINRLFEPKPIIDHQLGILVMCASIGLSLILVLWQRRTLKYEKSLTIEADNINYGSDVLINIGTVFVLLASYYGAPLWLDSVFALLGAGFMAFMARTVLVKSLNMLLDRELPDEDRNAIIRKIEAHEAVLGWHDLRTRYQGEFYDISFDIEVEPDLSLLDAHSITKDLESQLLKLYPMCEVMIHVDPKGFPHDARHRVKGVHM